MNVYLEEIRDKVIRGKHKEIEAPVKKAIVKAWIWSRL